MPKINKDYKRGESEGGVRSRRDRQVERERGGLRGEYKRKAVARRNLVELRQHPSEQLHSLVYKITDGGYRVNIPKVTHSEQCKDTQVRRSVGTINSCQGPQQRAICCRT